MKEVIAILRPNKVSETEAGLSRQGVLGYTITSVEGRGKQKGKRPSKMALGDVNISHTIGFVPKIMLSVVIDDEQVEGVVKKIININHSGSSGDGKIFVCPIVSSIRIRNRRNGEIDYGERTTLILLSIEHFMFDRAH